MAHQHMSKIFHDTYKYPLRYSYILNVRSLYKSLFTDEKNKKNKAAANYISTKFCFKVFCTLVKMHIQRAHEGLGLLLTISWCA